MAGFFRAVRQQAAVGLSAVPLSLHSSATLRNACGAATIPTALSTKQHSLQLKIAIFRNSLKNAYEDWTKL